MKEQQQQTSQEKKLQLIYNILFFQSALFNPFMFLFFFNQPSNL